MAFFHLIDLVQILELLSKLVGNVCVHTGRGGVQSAGAEARDGAHGCSTAHEHQREK